MISKIYKLGWKAVLYPKYLLLKNNFFKTSNAKTELQGFFSCERILIFDTLLEIYNIILIGNKDFYYRPF